MTRQWNTIAAVSALGTLLGCAQLGPASQPGAPQGTPAPGRDAPAVKLATVPAAAAQAAAPTADSAYLMGRAAHGSGQLAQARAHYAQVLAQEPRHVGALNGMAVIHAQEGQFDEAMKLFGQAMALAPEAAHLHNNAGYALLRAGRLAEAEAALLRAQALDPANPKTQQNLALLRAAQQRAGPAPASDQHSSSAQEPAAGPRLVTVARQVYELQPGPTPHAEAPLPVAAILPVAKPLRGVRVEVSNGVGVTRLARRTADRLAATGLVAARLTNAKPYRQATTEIQFGAGQEQMAQALKSHLPVAAKVVAMNRLQPGIQMRLVLGHDLTGRAIAAWLDESSEVRAASLKDEGWAWG